jgi:hypothetical protein|tara:strand:- start:363 stop:656 length:294 start_codon:yes stop_codon:yes gene_type:complete
LCRSLEEGLADGQFAVLKNSHIILKLDTKNGSSDFCEELDLKRNNSYVLLMNLNPLALRKTSKGETIRPLVESIRFTNPKDLKKILGCVKVIEGESE